jgi:hypothetical protein
MIFKDDSRAQTLFATRNYQGIGELIAQKIIRNLRSGPLRCPRKKSLNNIALNRRQISGLPGRHMPWPGRDISVLSCSVFKENDRLHM